MGLFFLESLLRIDLEKNKMSPLNGTVAVARLKTGYENRPREQLLARDRSVTILSRAPGYTAPAPCSCINISCYARHPEDGNMGSSLFDITAHSVWGQSFADSRNMEKLSRQHKINSIWVFALKNNANTPYEFIY